MRRAKAWFRFLRAKWTRSLGAIMIVIALLMLVDARYPWAYSLVIGMLGYAFLLYRKPHASAAEGEAALPLAHYVTVARSWNPTLIEVWRGLIEEAGIPCQVRDEFMGSTLFQYGQAVGHIQLQVPQEQSDAARKLIEGVALQGDGAAAGGPMLVCPRCSSANLLYAGSISPFMTISLVAVHMGLPVRRARHRCLQCGHKWPDDSPPAPNS